MGYQVLGSQVLGLLPAPGSRKGGGAGPGNAEPERDTVKGKVKCVTRVSIRTCP